MLSKCYWQNKDSFIHSSKATKSLGCFWIVNYLQRLHNLIPSVLQRCSIPSLSSRVLPSGKVASNFRRPPQRQEACCITRLTQALLWRC